MIINNLNLHCWRPQSSSRSFRDFLLRGFCFNTPFFSLISKKIKKRDRSNLRCLLKNFVIKLTQTYLIFCPIMASPYPKFENPFFEEKIIIDFLIRFFQNHLFFLKMSNFFQNFVFWRLLGEDVDFNFLNFRWREKVDHFRSVKP